MSADTTTIEPLSNREQEVADAYAEGKSYKEIARDLGLSPTTIRSHLRTVYGKLGVTSKIELSQFLNDPSGQQASESSSETIAELALELDDAIRREKNLAKVLRIISSRDRTDDAIDEILAHALDICEADFGVLFEHHGDMRFSGMHHRNISPSFADWLVENGVFEVDPETGLGLVATSHETINIADVRGDDLYERQVPLRLATADLAGARSFATIPMLSGGQLIGAFVVYRKRVHPFNDRSLELAQVFADQAAIAIEHVRQFQELQARLDQAMATRNILQLIRTSRDDELPIFEAITRNAVELCNAQFCMLWRYDGANINYCASHGFTSEFMEEYLVDYPMPPNPNGIVYQVVKAGETVHLPDAQKEPYSDAAVARQHGYDYMLGLPVITDDGMWGIMVLAWPKHLYPDNNQVQLLETFAAQAVIAIENARQFQELQARLDRQAATKEILHLISQNRDDEQPVFDVILKKACNLCGAQMGAFVLGEEGGTSQAMVAHSGVTEATLSLYENGHYTMDPDASYAARAIVEKRTLHVDDMAATEQYIKGDMRYRSLVDEQGIRTNLWVPLVSYDRGIGCLILFRLDVRPYTNEEISLVETFAEQAVIAIENARQFQEMQARLNRQEATKEILQLISRNRDDEQPVFDFILEKAATLCDSPMARLELANKDRTTFQCVAAWGEEMRSFQMGETMPLDLPNDLPTAIREGEMRHIHDLAESELYLARDPIRVRMVEKEGYRTYLVVPLVSYNIGVGAIVLCRREVAPFAEAEIALVESFAAQAVIAIENVRQFKALEKLNAELGDRVEEQVNEIERMGKLKRFLPSAVADTVVSRGAEEILSSHRALPGVLFCDIRGFTAFCETAEPEETIEVLQTYHEEMGKLINEHGAGVDHRMGDGIMVLFNDPVPCDDPAGEAVKLAVAMRARMAELSKNWKKLGHRLGFGVGVSLGYATVGMVGYEGRYDYTASGTAVNLAARLCDNAEDGEILLSPRAFTAIEDDFACEATGEINLKGIREPVEIYRLIES
ncbi:MAG: GAF domain-containing protein [Pseudomonadota bacterium]